MWKCTEQRTGTFICQGQCTQPHWLIVNLEWADPCRAWHMLKWSHYCSNLQPKPHIFVALLSAECKLCCMFSVQLLRQSYNDLAFYKPLHGSNIFGHEKWMNSFSRLPCSHLYGLLCLTILFIWSMEWLLCFFSPHRIPLLGHRLI